ncbi:hypothetical protein VTN96DRAFT_5527 [Rasamsonia emersonii]
MYHHPYGIYAFIRRRVDRPEAYTTEALSQESQTLLNEDSNTSTNFHDSETSSGELALDYRLPVKRSTGAGKTKLISRVVDDLLNNSGEQALAYFYCNRNEESRRQSMEVLRSFVKQLSISDDPKAIHGDLLKIYNERWQKGFSSNDLSLEEYALDESDEHSRKSLLDCFNRLIEKQSKNLKILISSRRDGDIRLQLERKANVGIEATNNQDDIAKFVAEKISQSEKDRRYPISESLKSEIIQVLLSKSRGISLKYYPWNASVIFVTGWDGYPTI